MTWPGACALFLAMVLLAALPSASVVLVVTRSATLGLRNGVAVAIGIVMGDLIFVSLAILGMSVLAETMGPFFVILKYLGGAYLIAMGIGLLRKKGGRNAGTVDSNGTTLVASFAAGLFLTLGDVKAILFYASLLPTFLNMENLSLAGVAIIIFITIGAVGAVKLSYAIAAQSIVLRWQTKPAQKYARLTAGGLLVGVGIYLLAKA